MNVLFDVLFGSGAAANQKLKREKTVVLCARCAAEHPVGAKFCGKCGHASLVAPSDYEQLQKVRRDQEMDELMRRQRRNLAIKRIQKLAAGTYCANCDLCSESGAQFCTQCGANIGDRKMPDEKIFAQVRRELPEVCPDWETYLAIKDASPEPGVAAKWLGLGVAKAVDRLIR
ncbi:MAG TPA: hypothetical protein VGO11_11840 [Chthoniobacteraceae bacterium]|jgi:ribosomal protein L40E|nr:hypothetical protein [Chthoniobacteraceae bacterium]